MPISFFLVLHRCRHVSGHPCRDVDREGVGAAAANHPTGGRWAKSHSGRSCLLDLSARRYGDSRPVLQRIFWKIGSASSRPKSSWAAFSSGPTRPSSLRATPTVLFLGTLLAAGGVVFNRVNVVICGHGLERGNASVRTGVLLPVHLRVGHLGWPHCCDHLPLRAGCPTHANSPQGRDWTCNRKSVTQ